jgi:hypothetical protein
MASVIAADEQYVWNSRRASLRSEVERWRLRERDVMKMPRDVAVRAWELQRRIWREDEDFRTLNASRVLRALTGGSLAAVHCFRDDAIVLQAHGYPNLAVRACELAMAILCDLELEPWVIAVEKGQILGRQAVAMPMSGEFGGRKRKRQLLDRAIDVTISGGAAAERTGLATLMRQQVALEVQWHSATRRPGRPSALHLAEDVLQDVSDAVDAKRHDSLLRTTWQATLMRWALAAGSPRDFQDAADRFITRLNALGVPLSNQSWRYRTLFHAARKRKGTWAHLDLPEPPLMVVAKRAATEPTSVVF